MNICDYGCDGEGKYQLKNDKWCCSKSQNSCIVIRKKNSEGMKGKNIGKKQSEEIKRKRSELLKGKKRPPFSEEWKKNISETKQGEDNPAWKGGISCEPYCQLWSDEEYKQSIKDRDGKKWINQ